MRILTVRQPWAWAIIHGGKDVENRARNIAGGYRGPVAIHVAREIDVHAIATPSRIHPAFREAADRYMAANSDPLKGSPWMGGIGNIIGVVDLIDVHSASVIGGCGRMDRNCDEHPHGCRHHCSPWAMGPAPEGWYQHLVLANPRPLSEPIPFKGALGLRRLDEAMVQRIEAAIA
ncbi:hypothetical protein [Microbacterium lacticum]|uniref:hypothetical protein n=1 Tax=Microbacterium lacticum TaxID=33885 RepID=UPI001F5A98D3|nr:hypothetical protein [Microbacterium lacticum]